jgi:hypothetical protein
MVKLWQPSQLGKDKVAPFFKGGLSKASLTLMAVISD